jgi:outer membrane receptor for ferrienterochelin and colicin
VVKNILIPVFLCLLVNMPLVAQQEVRVSGYVKNKLTGENLIGAYVIDQEAGSGTMTDNNGYFSIGIKGPGGLKFSFLGFKSYHIKIRKDTLVIVSLEPGEEQLSEVVISGHRHSNPNLTTINYNQMTNIPALGGKPDVIRSLQLMPGITSQVEGSSLMLVRGGDPGQNLYLFDNVPVIYVNHLGGFMSVFDPEIINNIEVYKGGFPSRYGGKLSSVVDITQKEGNKTGLRGSLGIGITDASFTIEGPLKEKASFILTGRKTLIDPLMALASALSDMSTYIVSYGFHDINAKATWKPDEKHSISMNLYHGDDYLNFWSHGAKTSIEKHRLGNAWGNWLASVRLNSLVTPRLYATNSISFTRYRLKEFMKYSVAGSDDTTKFERSYRSTVQDLSYRSGWKYNASANWLMEFGLQSSLLRLSPNDTYMSDRDVQPPVLVTNSLETALYADNRFSFRNNSYVIPGIRIVNHLAQGYSGFSFEPRLNLKIAVTKNHTLNASYMRVTQFSHLVFTTGNIMNNEVWVPAGKNIPPARSDQYTLGWNFDNNKSFSIEANAYYKSMSNLSAFREGYTNLWGDNNWISKVETGGRGESAGIELMIKKNSGKWTGFAGYVLSKTTRQFPGINNGKEYIFDYNRPHSFSLNISRKLKENLSLNLTWVYQSGLPFTPAIGRHYLPSPGKNYLGKDIYYEALIYGERNSSKLRDYHRLDLGLNYSTFTKRGRTAVWNFSVYNAYNRHNPVYCYYNTNTTIYGYSESKPVSLYQWSLFPIIPSLSYKLFFGDREEDNLYYSGLKPKRKTDYPPRESYIKNRWNLKAGYARYGTSRGTGSKTVPNYRIEANYGLTRRIETGVYLGYSKFNGIRWIAPGTAVTVYNPSYYFGLNCNLHLLPGIVRRDDFFLDLYPALRVGGIKGSHSEITSEYGAGGGVACYFWKDTGIYTEVIYERFYYHHDLVNVRYGITKKF